MAQCLAPILTDNINLKHKIKMKTLTTMLVAMLLL